MKKRFVGTIGRTVADTDWKFEIEEKCPRDAPNVVYIVLDDLGFAQLGCYGSTIHTPNIDAVAAEGLRYNNFHTTAICSATRASLLTGANHHAAGVNATTEGATGCEGAVGHIHSYYATIAEILKEYDYSTYAVGKWHLTTTPEINSAGPFDNWPLGKGFEKFYGFMPGQMDQYHPILIRDNGFVEREKPEDTAYHFSEDITTEAIKNISAQKNIYPDKPFFLYLSYGAMHAPHQAPKEYIEKYKGAFDEGWDVMREKWFKRQKEIGIIPQDAELTLRNEKVQEWSSLTDVQKKTFARFMEVFAAFLEYTDVQIGRLIDYLKEIEQYDNTVLVILSDNGASAEGGIEGRFNEMSGQAMAEVPDSAEEILAKLDEIGLENSQPHYPIGWANAGNTPFPWYKTYTHSGGVKDPLIISYPKLIKDKGGVREQYHHVSDITPTILDIIGLKKPESVKGVPQRAFQGISMKYTFANEEKKTRKRVQYYEIMGNRGIWKDGWKAIVNHTWSNSYAEDKWELYHVEEDYSEAHDVADQFPEKLRELQDEFLIEAAKNQVFPMVETHGSHSSTDVNLMQIYGPDRVEEETITFRSIRGSFVYNQRLMTEQNNFRMKAVIIRNEKTDDGAIISIGNRFGGWSFFVQDNHIQYVYNFLGKQIFHIVAKEELPIGTAEVELRFHMEEKQARAELYMNGKLQGETTITAFNKYYYEFAVIGADRFNSVFNTYSTPFEFKGEIKKLEVHTAAKNMNKREELEHFFAVD